MRQYVPMYETSLQMDIWPRASINNTVRRLNTRPRKISRPQDMDDLKLSGFSA